MAVVYYRDPEDGTFKPLAISGTGGADEVAVSDTPPTDGQTELWVDMSVPSGVLDPRYVAVTGDDMTGRLIIRAAADDPNGSNPFQIIRDAWPEIVLTKTRAPLNYKMWKINISGLADASGVDDSSLVFVPANDNAVTQTNYFILTRDGRTRLPGDIEFPTALNVGLRLAATDGASVIYRYLQMRTSSSGPPSLAVTQDKAGVTLGPLSVLTPSVPEHAATKAYVDKPTKTTGALTAYGTWTVTGDLLVLRAGWVYLKCATQKATAATIEQFATVPAGFRPDTEYLGVAWGGVATGGGHRLYNVSVDAAGAVKYRGNSQPIANELSTVLIMYPVA